MRPALKATTPYGKGLPARVRQNFPDYGSSTLATTRNTPPHTWQVSMSDLNTRLRHCTRFIAGRRSDSVPGSQPGCTAACRNRLSGVISAHQGLFGASKRKKSV